MNYYERHIGDHLCDTVGLSMLEDGAYGRLLDQFYQTEKPLPLDRSEIYRMARARSAAERKAVDYVVGKFFEKTDEGYIQKRAMEVLTEYWDRPEQAEKNTKEGNRERQRKSRERRKLLFEALAAHGIVPRYDTSMRDLEAMLSRVTSQPVTTVQRDMSRPVTRDVTQHVMAHVMGNHSPLPTNQLKPSPSSSVVGTSARSAFADEHVPTTAVEWANFFAAEQDVQADACIVRDREKLWPLATGWIEAKLSVGRMRAAIAKAKTDTGEPITYLPAYVNAVLANAQAREAWPPKARPLHRMTDNELVAEAKRVGAESYKLGRDELIARVQAKQKQLEGVAA